MFENQSEIIKADDLMKEDRKEEAKKILSELLGKNQNQEGIYQDAASIYFYGKMYTEAKEVFELYERKFGKKLMVEFTMEDIVKEEEELKKYSNDDVKIFKRLSLWGGEGLSSNYPTLFPINEIQIYCDRIILKVCSRNYIYRWSEIDSASIFRKESYGIIIQQPFIQKLFVLKTQNKIFKFDVSADYSDFERYDILIDEIKKHLRVKEGKMSFWMSLMVSVRQWASYIIGVAALIIVFKIIFFLFSVFVGEDHFKLK